MGQRNTLAHICSQKDRKKVVEREEKVEKKEQREKTEFGPGSVGQLVQSCRGGRGGFLGGGVAGGDRGEHAGSLLKCQSVYSGALEKGE